jgi:preprotein translocase subunit SecA
MTLYEQWQDKLENQNTSKEYADFFSRYLEQETVVYKQLLAEKRFVLEGSLAELAQQVDMDPVTFTGFLDGANTSFVQEVNLETLEETTPLNLTFEPEKLYYNMHVAKANWLYDLPEWTAILDDKTRRDIRMKYNQDSRATSEKVGRNDPCPCGSGKKYKKCCGANA